MSIPHSSFAPSKSIRSSYTNTTSTLSKTTSFSSIPLAARTRSMTRLSLSSVLADDHKFSKLDKITGKPVQSKGSALGDSGPRKVLGEKMSNVGRTSHDGLKRKFKSREEMQDAKRAKLGGSKLVVRRDDVDVEPKTPPRVSQPRGVSTESRAQPTPARVLLASHDTEDIEMGIEAPESSTVFVARPPTPPRPHVDTQRRRSPIKINLNNASAGDADSIEVTPTRPKSLTSATTPTNDSTLTPSLTRTLEKINLAPTTPTNAGPTPKRAMASISKFGKTPSKIPLAASPSKPSRTPMAQTTLHSFMRPVQQSKSSEMDVEAVAPDPARLGRDLLSVQDDDQMTDKPFEADLVESEQSHPSDPTETPALPADSSLVQDLRPPRSLTLPKSTTYRNLGTMLPPSILPSSLRASGSLAIAEPAAQPPKKSSIPVASTSKPSSSLGHGLPSSTAVSEQPIRRKPSYPSSLGSGPLARPRDRLVSGPTLYMQKDGTLGGKREEAAPKPKQSPRSVSEPMPRSRAVPSLSSSTSRREGLSMETSKSIAGLSDALNKLKSKRPESTTGLQQSRPSLASSSSRYGLNLAGIASDPEPIAQSSTSTLSSSATSSRLSSIHRPRQSIVPALAAPADESMTADESHAGDRSLAAIMSSASGEGCFKGVVAFVDVKTADGEDASGIFTSMLKNLGARVLSRMTENLTHIIYKSGKPTTLSWYRKQEDEDKPHIVGISWVIRSKEAGERLEEGPFKVDVGDEDIFQKRRKSMEPKALAASNQMTLTTAQSLASIKRKSMMYAPRVSSPLKRAYRPEEGGAKERRYGANGVYY